MSPINNSDTNGINRGVELILRRRREKEFTETKQKQFSFCKVFSLFRREIDIKFEMSILKKY
jgi:hypothetical protein